MGKFLVIEGMDGAGTTTQTKMLKDYLEKSGRTVIASAEPTKSIIGQEIRKLLAKPIESEQNLLTSLALCFAADRMQHVHEVINPGLASHDFVILDRYTMSSYVYQGIHMPTEFVAQINHYAPKPDLTIVCDIDANLAHERLSARKTSKDFYEKLPLLERIRNRYLHFAKISPSPCVVVDASDSVSQVHSHIVHVINEL